MTAHTVRKGQTTNEPTVKKNETNKVRNDPRNAKPAPGPIYARKGEIINVQVTSFGVDVTHVNGFCLVCPNSVDFGGSAV